MKKIIASIFALCAILISCEKAETETALEAAVYSGTFSVILSDGSLYEKDGVEAAYLLSDDEENLKLMFYGVSFSPKMPLSLDVTVDGVNSNVKDGKITVSGDDIVPTAMGGPFPAYTVTGLTGSIDKNNMSLQLNFGSNACSFTGIIKTE